MVGLPVQNLIQRRFGIAQATIIDLLDNPVDRVRAIGAIAHDILRFNANHCSTTMQITIHTLPS